MASYVMLKIAKENKSEYPDAAAILRLACLQAVTGGFIAENPFRSLIERHLGFLRRALPGTSGQAQKSREGEGEGREKPPARKPAPLE